MRGFVRRLARTRPSIRTVVMGCAAALDDGVIARLPGVSAVVGGADAGPRRRGPGPRAVPRPPRCGNSRTARAPGSRSRMAATSTAPSARRRWRGATIARATPTRSWPRRGSSPGITPRSCSPACTSAPMARIVAGPWAASRRCWWSGWKGCGSGCRQSRRPRSATISPGSWPSGPTGSPRTCTRRSSRAATGASAHGPPLVHRRRVRPGASRRSRPGSGPSDWAPT